MVRMSLVILVSVFFAQTTLAEENKPANRLFPTVPLLGEQKENDIRSYLYDIGDKDAMVPNKKVKSIETQTKTSATKPPKGKKPDVTKVNMSLIKKRPWQHTEYQLGYVTSAITGFGAVTPGHSVTPASLKKVNIKLDKIRTYDYPGSGMHKILFTFEAKNATTDGKLSEAVAFNQSYKANEAEGAGISGYPIFTNLNVAPTGLAFKISLTNVSNDTDEEALKALDSNECKAGLTLLTTAQPAIAPFAEIALSVSKMVMSRNKNKLVQDVYLGLDGDTTAASGARLNAGNYIVVQAPDDQFQWSEWVFDKVNARLVNAKDHKRLPPYNYFIFRVSKVD